MKKVIFIKDFATKIKGDVGVYDSMHAASLVIEGAGKILKEKTMITLEVLKKDARIGNREVGKKFAADEKAANVWIELKLVRDINAPVKKAKATKKKDKK